MTIASSTDVFFDQLRDLQSATGQTVKTLPDLIRWATQAKLRDHLANYSTATTAHLGQIRLIFDGHSVESGQDLCKAMAGLIDGGNTHLAMAADSIVRDHLLIAHCHRIGHYLEAAAAFTLGIARKCGLSTEADAVAEMVARHRAFTDGLAEIGADAFGLEMGGCP
jgi:ferritin-like metal-binding protein YciE